MTTVEAGRCKAGPAICGRRVTPIRTIALWCRSAARLLSRCGRGSGASRCSMRGPVGSRRGRGHLVVGSTSVKGGPPTISTQIAVAERSAPNSRGLLLASEGSGRARTERISWSRERHRSICCRRALP